jgi:hypothetical protein
VSPFEAGGPGIVLDSELIEEFEGLAKDFDSVQRRRPRRADFVGRLQ